VQQFAGIREALVQALVSRYGDADKKPYLRISRAPPGQADVKSRVIAALGAAALEKIAAQAGMTGSTCLLGGYDFAGSPERYAGLMAGWLNAAPDNCIILCHPALSAEPDDAIGPARVREFAYLSGAEFVSALNRSGVYLSRYPVRVDQIGF
jgi:hypothetical protein